MKALVSTMLIALAAASMGLQDGRGGTQPLFQAIDVYVDCGQAALGAYQVELKSDSPGAMVVGIEGGEHAAYADPPYYDPAALHADQLKERIVLAAFSTAAELPSGRTRVARIHVQVRNDAKYEVVLEAAGARGGEKIQGKAEVVPFR